MPISSNRTFESYPDTHLKFLEALPEALWVAQTGRVIFANSAALTLVGATEAAQVISQPLVNFILSPLPLTNKQLHTCEIRRMDGSVLQAQIKTAAGPELETPTIILIAQQAQIAETEIKLQHYQVAQVLTEGIVIQDRQGQIILCNRNAEEILGLTAAQLAKQKSIDPHWRAIQSNGAPFLETQQPTQITLRTGKAQRHVVMGIYKPNGDLTWMAINSEPLALGPDGLPLQVVTTYTDITYSTFTTEALQQSEERYRELISSIRAIIWQADANTFQFSFVSTEAEILLGYPISEWLASPSFWADHIHPEDRTWAVDFCVMATREKRYHEFEYRMIAADGRIVWLRDIVNVTVQNNMPKELIGVMVDVTERKLVEERLQASLQEKEVILREIYHRVKNNLQVMASLLEMQAMTLADPQVTAAFRESGNRIYSMALVHEELYQSSNLAEVDFKDYVERLLFNVFNSFKIEGSIKLTLEIAPLSLNVDTAIPCGLILNELVSNAIKYAFPQPKADDEIKVAFANVPEQSDQYFLQVCDNGVGLPPEVNPQQHSHTLGLELVNVLTKQIKGTLAWANNGGATFIITFARSQRPSLHAN